MKYDVKTFETSEMITKVYIPKLTPEEKARRMNVIHNAAIDLLKSKEHSRK